MVLSCVDTKGGDLLSRKDLLRFHEENVGICVANAVVIYIPNICNGEAENEGPYHPKDKLEISVNDIFN